MIGRAAIVAAATLLLTAATAGAEAPPGPRLAVVELAGGPTRIELKSVDENGADGLRLAGGGRRTRPLPIFEPPSWSADGAMLAFAGEGGKVPGSQGFILDETEIFLVGADGSGLRPVPGTLDGRRPVLSPDGRELAFTRVKEHKHEDSRGAEHVKYRSYSVWLEDLDTGVVTQLTPWRNGLTMVANSFSPDGSTLAVSRRKTDRSSSELLAMPLGGGPPRLIARNATEGVYSPDGSRIAFLRLRVSTKKVARTRHKQLFTIEETTDLFVAKADGAGAKRLTRTQRGIEVWPSWDPSGDRLAFTRLKGGSEAGDLGIGDSVVEMNADGSCPRAVLTARRAAYFGATWQPGPGREAGRISC